MAGCRQRLRPGNIRFTQDSVGSRFTDGRFVSDTFHQLLDGRISVDDIPAIETVVDGGEWWAVTGNRRLYVFRLLETLGVVQTIPVDVMSMGSYDVRRRFGDRKTTPCEGRTIEMRQSEAERRINQAIREWQKTNRCTYRRKISANEALEPSASRRGGLLENEEETGSSEDTRNLISEARGENQRKPRKYPMRAAHSVQAQTNIEPLCRVPVLIETSSGQTNLQNTREQRIASGASHRRDVRWPDESRHQRTTLSVEPTDVEPVIRGVSQNSGSRRDFSRSNESSEHQAAVIENAWRVGQRNLIASNSESEDLVVTRQPRSVNQDENNYSQENSDGFCARRCCFCCSY